MSVFRVLATLLFSLAVVAAQARDPGRTLLVAAAPCPPIVIKQEGGLTGLGIILWQQIAEEMGVTSEFVDMPLGDMLTAISTEPQDGQRRVDVGVSCLSITAEREKIVDFSHSFHETHTGIAVRDRSMSEMVAQVMLSSRVWRAILIVFGIAALVGSIFFLLEGRINEKLYSMKTPLGRAMEALIVGLLFITRGPIRYYEFKTMTARMFSALLAIGSTFLIAGITAVLASAFTLETLQSRVSGLDDLRNVRVGAIQSSTSSRLLSQRGVAHSRWDDSESMLLALYQGQLDAIVADASFLRYAIQRGREQGTYENLFVLPEKLEKQNYGLALVPGSQLEEAVNQALLNVRKGTLWRQKLAEYLGE